ncbi:MAG: cupredoxin domain-containing protein [Actinobacteria bacterium]|nr:cupredoxin domain-containing protein [Actinomycetota bacterium]
MRTAAKLLLMMGSAVTAFLPAMPAADAAVTEHATIANFSFSPNPVKVPLGATLEWTNTDGTAHTITADDGSFSSGSLASNAKFSHTFDRPGPVAYHCAIHSSMKGTVEVETPPTTAAPTTTTTAAPTTTTAAPADPGSGTTSPTTAVPAAPKPTAPKPAPSTTRATAAPTTTAPAAATPAPTVAAPTIDASAPETTATAPLPEQAAPPAETALDTPSGESGNGGAVGVGLAIAAILLLGGGGWWAWRRRVSAG